MHSVVNRQFQIACLTASVLGLTSLGVFADSDEAEALENKLAPLEEVIVLGRFLQSEAVRLFARLPQSLTCPRALAS